MPCFELLPAARLSNGVRWSTEATFSTSTPQKDDEYLDCTTSTFDEYLESISTEGLTAEPEVLVPLTFLLMSSLLALAFFCACCGLVVFRKKINSVIEKLDKSAHDLAMKLSSAGKLTTVAKAKQDEEDKEKEEAEQTNDEMKSMGVLDDGSLLGQFLHTAFVPGLDDQDDLMVNPVLVHQMEVITQQYSILSRHPTLTSPSTTPRSALQSLRVNFATRLRRRAWRWIRLAQSR